MQPDSQSCNSCDYETTKSQKSLTCNICLNHYHYNRHCLRLVIARMRSDNCNFYLLNADLTDTK